MAFVVAVVDVQDASGFTLCDVVDANGKKSRIPIALKLDPSITATPLRVGDQLVVTLALGSGGVTTAAVLAALVGQTIVSGGLVLTGDVTLNGNVNVGGAIYPGGSPAVVTTNVTPTDIGSPIAIPVGAPVAIAAITMAFVGYDSGATGTIVLRRLYTVGRTGSANVVGSMPQVLGTDIVSAGADTGATTNGRVIGGTFQPQVTGVSGQSIRWRSYVVDIVLYT